MYVPLVLELDVECWMERAFNKCSSQEMKMMISMKRAISTMVAKAISFTWYNRAVFHCRVHIVGRGPGDSDAISFRTM